MRKVLLGVAVVVVLALAGLSLAMRHMSHASSPPEKVPGVEGVLMERAGFVYEYAAKTSTGTVALFDAGIDPEGHGIDALLGELHAGRDDVRDVFVTHGHPDHIAAIPFLPHAVAHGGAGDIDLAAGKRHSSGFLPTLMRLLQAPAVATIGDGLEGKRELKLGPETVTAIPCPGHTRGSTLYLFRGALFVGDAMQYQKDALGPPPGPFTEDMAAAKACIAGLEKTTAGLGVKTICTGHNGCTPPEKTAGLIAAAAR